MTIVDRFLERSEYTDEQKDKTMGDRMKVYVRRLELNGLQNIDGFHLHLQAVEYVFYADLQR